MAKKKSPREMTPEEVQAATDILPYHYSYNNVSNSIESAHSGEGGYGEIGLLEIKVLTDYLYQIGVDAYAF